VLRQPAKPVGSSGNQQTTSVATRNFLSKTRSEREAPLTEPLIDVDVKVSSTGFRNHFERIIVKSETTPGRGGLANPSPEYGRIMKRETSRY